MQNHLPILVTCGLLSTISYPKATFYLLLATTGLRIMYTNAYLSLRGFNRATASEEVLKLLLVVLVCTSFASSVKMMGINRQVIRQMWKNKSIR